MPGSVFISEDTVTATLHPPGAKKPIGSTFGLFLALSAGTPLLWVKYCIF